MCWADRTALAVVSIIALVVFTTTTSDPASWNAWQLLADFGKIALLIWVPLRVIDFAAGGPARRRFAAPSRGFAPLVKKPGGGIFPHEWRLRRP